MLTSNDRDRSQPVKVLYWNCNGISGKRHHLELLLQQYKPDIFALSESKLISSVSDKEVCDKYTLYRHDRVNSIGRGGGVLIGSWIPATSRSTMFLNQTLVRSCLLSLTYVAILLHLQFITVALWRDM